MTKLSVSRLLLVIAVAMIVTPVKAQELTFIAPINGPSAIIGKQIRDGSEFPVVDDGCAAEMASVATKNALARGARMLIGFPCVEALDAAADIVAQSPDGEIILTLGVQAQSVTDRDRRPDWPVYRLGAPAAQEAELIAEYIKGAWREKQIAIIDDGTLYGRQLAENVRLLLEIDNLKPVFTDTYRPLLERQFGLVRRIAKAGATHVFIGGDAHDAAIIGSNATEAGITLTLAGGSAFQAPPQDGKLAEGVVYAALSETQLLLAAASPDAPFYYELLGRVGKQIGEQALAATKDKNVALRQAMQTTDFQTDIGTVVFDKNGENNTDWFSVYEVRGGKPMRLTKNGIGQ